MFPSSTLFHYPILLVLSDGNEHAIKEFREKIIEVLGISAEDQKITIKSGDNKVSSWITFAIRNLKDANLIATKVSGSGKYYITELGKQMLLLNPNGFKGGPGSSLIRLINSMGLSLDPTRKETETAEDTNPNKSLYVILEEAYKGINESLPDKILDKVKQLDPKAFERLVRDLIAKIMNVKSSKDAVVTQYSKDGGIDGYLNADEFGMKKLCCFQAKRWENAVGVKPVRELVGSLVEMKCDNGIIVTTSYFSKEAKDYPSRQYNIILIDGKKLANLMIDSGIGITEKTYVVKELDNDYLENL